MLLSIKGIAQKPKDKYYFEFIIEGNKGDTLHKGKEYNVTAKVYKDKCSYMQVSGKGYKITPNGCGKYTISIPTDSEDEYIELCGVLKYGKEKDYFKKCNKYVLK